MRYIVREYELDRIRFMYTRITEAQSDEELKARLDDYKERLLVCQRDQTRHISILEFSASSQYSPQQRRIQSEWNLEAEALLRNVQVTVIFVTPSMLMRGVITAVFWIAPPPFPYEVCEDIYAALARAYEMCEGEGVKVDHLARDHIRHCLLN